MPLKYPRDDGLPSRESVGKLSIENLHQHDHILERSGGPGLQESRKYYLIASFSASCFLPLLLIIALAIKLDSRAPVLQAGRIAGRQIIQLDKIRSMTVDAEKDGPVWAVVNDQRVTASGDASQAPAG